MRRLIPGFLIIASFVVASHAYSADTQYCTTSVPVELRGIWVDAGSIPKTESGIREFVRFCRSANLNVLFPEVIARGYTVYPSHIIERDPRFDGEIDPLPPMIDEAHKLGMEVHPWVWCFRAGYTKDRGAILTRHPEWVELDRNGRDLSANGGLWISPCIPAARTLLANLFEELVRTYDVDGLHLDYIRYEVQSPNPYGYSDTSRRLFESQYAIDPLTIDRLSFNQYEWHRFRERQINTFVHQIAVQTRKIRKRVRISAAVGSDPVTARTNLMQNWVNWVENGWVDFVTPMAYTNNDQTFTRLVSTQQKAVGGIAVVAPGIGLHTQKEAPEQTVGQVRIARGLYTEGQCLFAAAYFSDQHHSALADGPYSSPARVPFRKPWERSKELCAAAGALREQGASAAADHLSRMACALAEYATYRKLDLPYVVPTPPPLQIPEYVIPLPEVKAARTEGTIRIDGKLHEPCWQSWHQVTLDYTNEGDAASVQTTARVVYDSEALYIGFECVEPQMTSIKALVEKRDGPTFYDDSVEVFIDTKGDQAEYFHLSTNTLGTQFDQKVFNVGWNGDWQAASQLNADGWTAEVTIPYAVLGVDPPSPGDAWRLNLTRNRTASGTLEYLTWAVPYGSFHSPDRFGTLVF